MAIRTGHLRQDRQGRRRLCRRGWRHRPPQEKLIGLVPALLTSWRLCAVALDVPGALLLSHPLLPDEAPHREVGVPTPVARPVPAASSAEAARRASDRTCHL